LHENKEKNTEGTAQPGIVTEERLEIGMLHTHTTARIELRHYFVAWGAESTVALKRRRTVITIYGRHRSSLKNRLEFLIFHEPIHIESPNRKVEPGSYGKQDYRYESEGPKDSIPFCIEHKALL